MLSTCTTSCEESASAISTHQELSGHVETVGDTFPAGFYNLVHGRQGAKDVEDPNQCQKHAEASARGLYASDDPRVLVVVELGVQLLPKQLFELPHFQLLLNATVSSRKHNFARLTTDLQDAYVPEEDAGVQICRRLEGPRQKRSENGEDEISSSAVESKRQWFELDLRVEPTSLERIQDKSWEKELGQHRLPGLQAVPAENAFRKPWRAYLYGRLVLLLNIGNLFCGSVQEEDPSQPVRADCLVHKQECSRRRECSHQCHELLEDELQREEAESKRQEKRPLAHLVLIISSLHPQDFEDWDEDDEQRCNEPGEEPPPGVGVIQLKHADCVVEAAKPQHLRRRQQLPATEHIAFQITRSRDRSRTLLTGQTAAAPCPRPFLGGRLFFNYLSRLAMEHERCGCWIANKRRLCAAQALAGSKHCGNHQEIGAAAKARVPCPADPSHSILQDRVESHLRKCPAIKMSQAVTQCPYYSQGLNAGSDDEEDGQDKDSTTCAARRRAAFDALLKDAFEELVNRIETAYHQCRSSIKVEERILEPAACTKWLTSQVDKRHPQQAKHIVQQASMLGNLDDFGLLNRTDDGTKCAFIELGAGRGYLSQMLSDCYQADKVLLVERRSYKFKADRTLRYTSGLSMTRLRVDIQDLQLDAVDELQDHRVVAIGKHICGAATDLALRCCFGTSKRVVTGIGFATCCHHLCQWKSYVNKSFFRALGFSKPEFEVITWLTSWALTGQLDEKAELGFKCKQLLDMGRVAWLRGRCSSVGMVEYVTAAVSPENKLILAKLNSS